MGMTASGLATRKFCPRYVENSVMSSPKRSFRSCVISLSHGVVTITAGGLGGAAWAAAAGLGAAGFGARGARLFVGGGAPPHAGRVGERRVSAPEQPAFRSGWRPRPRREEAPPSPRAFARQPFDFLAKITTHITCP